MLHYLDAERKVETLHAQYSHDPIVVAGGAEEYNYQFFLPHLQDHKSFLGNNYSNQADHYLENPQDDQQDNYLKLTEAFPLMIFRTADGCPLYFLKVVPKIRISGVEAEAVEVVALDVGFGIDKDGTYFLLRTPQR